MKIYITHKIKILSLSYILLIYISTFTLASLANAAGLGYLNIRSTLGKPLIAEIDILGKIDANANSTVELASFDEYNQQHLDYSVDLEDAQINIIKNKNTNKAFIRITTKGNFN